MSRQSCKSCDRFYRGAEMVQRYGLTKTGYCTEIDITKGYVREDEGEECIYYRRGRYYDEE